MYGAPSMSLCCSNSWRAGSLTCVWNTVQAVIEKQQDELEKLAHQLSEASRGTKSQLERLEDQHRQELNTLASAHPGVLDTLTVWCCCHSTVMAHECPLRSSSVSPRRPTAVKASLSRQVRVWKRLLQHEVTLLSSSLPQRALLRQLCGQS